MKNHIKFAEAMKPFSQGQIALYHPPTTKNMFVGAYGYFDDDGYWIGLGKVPDPENWPHSHVDNDVKNEYKCFVSNGVDQEKLDASLTQTFFPGMDIGFKFIVGKETKFAAVLVPKQPCNVRCTVNDIFFRDWGRENYKKIRHPTDSKLKVHHGGLEKHSLFIVTKVTEAPGCALTTFGGQRATARIGFKGSVAGTAGVDLGGGAEWSLEHGRWSEFPGERVIFVSGWRRRHNYLPGFRFTYDGKLIRGAVPLPAEPSLDNEGEWDQAVFDETVEDER